MPQKIENFNADYMLRTDIRSDIFAYMKLCMLSINVIYLFQII